ncbi:hypothetical protein BDW74DRAFT_180859 [Aspergillus multicolor]|uniref:uncharacterized protein n=1 Tax=Aspergillus multicolor TaxID=41759 RepID=UPI003CCC9B57
MAPPTTIPTSQSHLEVSELESKSNSKSSLIFEVTGEHPSFARNEINDAPESDADFLNKLFVGVVGDDDVQRVTDALESVTVDNEAVEWDFQDYVLEILDRLARSLCSMRRMRSIAMRGGS